jgi:hypothetical protein
MKFLLVLMAVVSSAADLPHVIYTKSFPGSTPAYMFISVGEDSSVTYNESTDKDNAEKFQLEPATTAAIFDYAERLGHFSRPLESGLKVANMGAKTLRWENGSEVSEAKYNYSQDEDAQKLTDIFESISSSDRLFIQLKRSIRYDKLGVNDALLQIHILYNQKKLLAAAQFLPLFDRVAKDETFLHMARERAAELAEYIRNPPKEKGR